MKTSSLKRGTSVEVRKIVAGCAPGYGEPLHSWIPGYVFEAEEPGGTILVRRTRGMFAGCTSRYPQENVRKDQSAQ